MKNSYTLRVHPHQFGHADASETNWDERLEDRSVPRKPSSVFRSSIFWLESSSEKKVNTSIIIG